VANDEEEVKRWARYLQLSASPGSAVAMMQMWLDTDIRAVLPTVRVPTLVLTRSDPPHDRNQVARWVADQIDGARSPRSPDVISLRGSATRMRSSTRSRSS
jgi:hypothetical protein